MDRFKNRTSLDRSLIAFQQHQHHQHNLLSIKPTVDPNLPSRFIRNHQSRGKTAYLEKTRQKQIRRENSLLCEKIQRAMKVQTPKTSVSRRKSLNRHTRKKEAERILYENAKIYKAISEMQPEITVSDMDKFFYQQQQFRQQLLSGSKYNVWFTFRDSPPRFRHSYSGSK